jgi:hypothetical protein
MPEPTDLRRICSALEHFFLPAALGNIKDDAFVVWNRDFEKRAGVSEKVLAQAQLTSLLLLDESYGGSSCKIQFSTMGSVRTMRSQKACDR